MHQFAEEDVPVKLEQLAQRLPQGFQPRDAAIGLAVVDPLRMKLFLEIKLHGFFRRRAERADALVVSGPRSEAEPVQVVAYQVDRV